jgi:hypothetical protein
MSIIAYRTGIIDKLKESSFSSSRSKRCSRALVSKSGKSYTPREAGYGGLALISHRK